MGPSLVLPSTRQRVTDGPRGDTKLELRTWKERLGDGCAVGEEEAKGDFIAACSSLLGWCGGDGDGGAQ